MVTWGTNTTHVFGGSNTPAGGTTAPTPAPTFGSTPATPPASGTGLFGSKPAPAPATGGIFSTPTFGSSPAPAAPLLGSTPAPSGGGLFAAAPAPATGSLFGTTPTAAPSPAMGGLFGSTPAPAPLFGASSAPSAFGAPQQQQQQQQQIPAQAAMQAHMDASARQEQARLMMELEKLHNAYTGAPPKESNDKVPFMSIVYNDITPEQRQLQWMHRSNGAAAVVPPPKPVHVAEKEWLEAVVRNPDAERYMPAMILGADMLRMRVVWQQERAKSLAEGASQLQSAHETLQSQCRQYQANVQHLARTHAALRKRLLDVMRKVEVVRCMNLPIQADEVKAGQQISKLLRQVDQVATAMAAIQDMVRNQPRLSTPAQVALPDETRLQEVLKEQRDGIESLTKLVQHDVRDIRLLQQRIVQKVAAPPTM